ncbi:MAG: response regulator [Bacteroidetes bacterium]|jgi:CheY-like chemotaxis protein|nr:response regulator [Bacteroidota bacterium]
MKHVVIIDDDEIFQFTTRVRFQKLKLAIKVSIFSDGEEAFEFVKSGDYDDLPNALLLDINMPVIGRWDFIELFKDLPKEKTKNVHIYMLSSSVNPEDMQRAEANGLVIDYVTKPRLFHSYGFCKVSRLVYVTSPHYRYVV